MTNKQALEAARRLYNHTYSADEIRYDDLLIVEAALSQPANKMMLDALKSDADAAYCRYIDIIDRDCRGTEHHIEHGTFSLEMYESHRNANEKLGFHRGIHHALKAIAAASAPVVEVGVEELRRELTFDLFTKVDGMTENNALKIADFFLERLQLARQKGGE